jgi:hypothetical protein
MQKLMSSDSGAGILNISIFLKGGIPYNIKPMSRVSCLPGHHALDLVVTTPEKISFVLRHTVDDSQGPSFMEVSNLRCLALEDASCGP